MPKVHHYAAFSMIEIVIALGIFSLFVTGIASSASLTYIAEKQGGENTIVQAYAQEGIEAVRSIGKRGWSELLIGTHGLTKSNNYWELSGANETIGDYQREIIISEVYRDVNNNIVTSNGTLDQHTKKITVNIRWPVNGDLDHIFTLDTYLTNWSSRDWQQTDWSGGDGQASWSTVNRFMQKEEGVDISTVGEVKLNLAGANPSPYALLLHLDGPRYKDNGKILNSSFEQYSGTVPNINWNDWDEWNLGAQYINTTGQSGTTAAEVFFEWPGMSNLGQVNIPVTPNSSYQFSFYVKGTVSLLYLSAWDQDSRYLQNNGSMNWGYNLISVPMSETWTQYSITITTSSASNYLTFYLSGVAVGLNKYYAVDNFALADEIVYDSSSYNNNGSRQPLGSIPSYVSGKFSQAINFDGASGSTSGDYLKIPASDSLNIVGNITLEAWVYPTALGNSIDRPIITKWQWNDGNKRSYRLYINNSRKLVMAISKDGQGGNNHEYSVTSSDAISLSQWTHVIGSYNGTTLKVYINGEEKGSQGCDSAIYNSGNNVPVLIGSIDNNLRDNNRFKGMIDEVSIENIALGETEAYEHYTNSPLTPESVIVWVSPVPVGIFMTDKKVAGMQMYNNDLFVALLEKKNLETFNMNTDPANPTSYGTFSTTQHSEDVVVLNKYIYVITDIANNGVEIYQYTSNPSDAQYIGSLTLADTPRGAFIYNNYLYITLENHSVAVYNLSPNPNAPVYQGSFATIQEPNDIVIHNNYAYVALNNTDQAIQVFDIGANPVNPPQTSIIGAIEAPVGMTARDGYLLAVTGGAARKVLVFNIETDPAIPTALGDMDIIDNGRDIAMRGSYLYVGLGGSLKGIQVFDMTFMLAGGSGESNYQVYGTLESSAFDTGNAAGFNFISWTESLPSAEDDIKVQIKTASTFDGLSIAPWSGPYGPGSFFESGNEAIILPAVGYNGKRYVKYLIHLYGSGDTTPTLQDIKINYTP